MPDTLYKVELLGETWFVDERLKEYRSVSNGDKPILFFSFKDMDNMMELKDMLDNIGNLSLDIDANVEKILRALFESAMMGDRSSVENIASIFDAAS